MEAHSPFRENEERLKQYPRSYSIHDATRRAFDAIGLAPLGVVTGISVLDLVGLVNSAVTPFDLLALGFLAAIFALLVFRSAHRRVILYEDGIVVLGIFSTRKLKRSEILGRRMGRLPPQAGGGSFYIIVPADSSARELTLPPFLAVDKDFFAWMKEIPQIETNAGRASA